MRTDLDVHNGPIGLGYFQRGNISKQHSLATRLDVCQISMQGTLGETDFFGHDNRIGDLAIFRHDLADEDGMCIPYPGANKSVGKREAHTLRAFSQQSHTVTPKLLRLTFSEVLRIESVLSKMDLN